MKKYYFLIICLFLNLQGIFAQEKTISKNVELKDDLNVVLSEGRFLFPDYQDAIFYNDKGPGKAKMNYNMLTDEMMFINPDGDTLSLANPGDIRRITFGKKEFVYTAKGFLEVLAENDNNISLLIGRRIKQTDIKQYGGYGITTATSSIDKVSSISDSPTVEKFNIHQEFTYAINNVYYLKNNNALSIATEKNFQKIFGKAKKGIISKYISDNNLDLKKQDDLISLFNYCLQN